MRARGTAHTKMAGDVISRNPHVLGGLPVFAGTRVPIRALFEFLAAGDTVEEFLENYPNVRRDQVKAVLESAGQTLLV